MSKWNDRTPEAREYRRLYSTQRWRKGRRDFLAACPLCRYCEAQGRTRLATVVDHIKEHRGDLELFWDEGNWQPLCKPHHDGAKAQEERGGYSAMADADGYPIDPNHPSNRGLL